MDGNGIQHAMLQRTWYLSYNFEMLNYFPFQFQNAIANNCVTYLHPKEFIHYCLQLEWTVWTVSRSNDHGMTCLPGIDIAITRLQPAPG